jgi:hypothetical protein
MMLACYAHALVRALRRMTMTKTVFAMAVAGLVFAAASGTSQAAPIAPLPAGTQAESGNLTPVYYRYHYHRYYRHCWWHHGYRHCW